MNTRELAKAALSGQGTTNTASTLAHPTYFRHKTEVLKLGVEQSCILGSHREGQALLQEMHMQSH